MLGYLHLHNRNVARSPKRRQAALVDSLLVPFRLHPQLGPEPTPRRDRASRHGPGTTYAIAVAPSRHQLLHVAVAHLPRIRQRRETRAIDSRSSLGIPNVSSHSSQKVPSLSSRRNTRRGPSPEARPAPFSSLRRDDGARGACPRRSSGRRSPVAGAEVAAVIHQGLQQQGLHPIAAGHSHGSPVAPSEARAREVLHPHPGKRSESGCC